MEAPAESQNLFFYYGSSMKGTLRPGDCMTVEPVTLDCLRPGDVVIYRKPETQRPDQDRVVHRIIKVIPGGCITRGDNNHQQDSDVVLAENLIGRVTQVDRDQKTIHISGGRRGYWRGRGLHLLNPLQLRALILAQKYIYPFGRWFYRWLRRSRLVGYVWRPKITQVQIESSVGPVIKYVVGKRAVAYWFPQHRRFKCIKPYDLVIHEPDHDS